MKATALVLLALMSILSPVHKAADGSERGVELVRQLRSAIQQATLSSFQAPPDLRESVDKALSTLRPDLAELERLMASAQPTTEYLASLKDQAAAMDRVSRGSSLQPAEKAQICLAVAQDIKAKAARARIAAPTSRGPIVGFANVAVVAATKRGDKEVSGCEVWCVVRGWDGVQSKYRRFPHLSSPTTLKLAPGVYSMWSEQAQRKGVKKPVVVGEALAEEEQVDLPAPE